MIAESGGMAGVTGSVHMMIAVGIVMALNYAYVIGWPFRALRAAVARADWPAGAASMSRIRMLVAVNLALGVVALVLGAFAR